jgi:hypothetical protein
MKTVFALLIFFLAMGVFVRSYNRWTSASLVAGVVVLLLFLSLTT